MNRKTSFDSYLDLQLQDPEVARRFKDAGKSWEIALQLSRLREKKGLSQKELARMVGTSQQQISRLESPAYEGHSISMLRRISAALDARVQLKIVPNASALQAVAEEKPEYRLDFKDTL